MVFERLLPAQVLNQTVGELRREEAWCDGVGRDVPWTELDSQLPRHVVRGGLGDAVHDCTVFANVRDGCTSGRGHDNYTRGVLACACTFKKRRKSVELARVKKYIVISYSLAKLNTPLTFRSRTFLLDQSGVGSNGPPHVAPALQTRMSSFPSDSSTFFTRRSISSVSATLAAKPTAVPETGSLLSFSTA